MANQLTKELYLRSKKVLIDAFNDRTFHTLLSSTDEEYIRNKDNIEKHPRSELKLIKEVMKINGMVIGHNVTFNKKINNRLPDLYGIDVALSRGFGIKDNNILPQILHFKKNGKIIDIEIDYSKL